MCRSKTPSAPPPPLPTNSNIGVNGVAAPGSVGISALERQGAPALGDDAKDKLALAALRKGTRRFTVNLNAGGKKLVKATDAWKPGLKVPTAKNPVVPTGPVALKKVALPKAVTPGPILPNNPPPAKK